MSLPFVILQDIHSIEERLTYLEAALVEENLTISIEPLQEALNTLRDEAQRQIQARGEKIEHVCCGFVAYSQEVMHKHIKTDCPVILEARNRPATVVDVDGMRIVAGHPKAVDEYFKQKGSE